MTAKTGNGKKKRMAKTIMQMDDDADDEKGRGRKKADID